MKITDCRFECAAFRPEDEPHAPGPDVVFVGRSNVGKSSLINRLLGVQGLAKTSSSPGRTQSVNFFRVNECCYFVDLPGYGYARVPEEVRRSWGPMVEGFLERRQRRIALTLMVIDARRNPTALDRTMRDWLQDKAIPYLVVATKSDKLSGNRRARAARELSQEFSRPPAGGTGVGPVFVSAQSGAGIREVWRHLDPALARAKRQEAQRHLTQSDKE